MARMLGHLRRGGCSNSRCRSCHEEDTTRWRKRVEARQWLAAEGWLPDGALPLPGTDESDCRHGCNGSHVVAGYPSNRCGWQCHPGLTLDPDQAARFDEMMETGAS